MAASASSYYILYTKDKKESEHDNRSSPKDSDNDNDSNSSNNKNKNNNNQFWQEFEWTTNDKEKVIKLLQQNQQRCDIIENSITQQRGKYTIDKYEKDAGLHWNNFYSSHETKFFKDRHYLHKAFPNEFGILYANRYNDENENEDENEKDGTMRGEGSKKEDEIKVIIDSDDENFTITEIGCGVGNTVLPLLELDHFILDPVSTHVHDSSSSSSSRSSSNDNNTSNKETVYKKKKLIIWGLDFSSVAIDLLRQDKRYINATTTTNDRARAQVWDITSTHPRDIVTISPPRPSPSNQQKLQQQLQQNKQDQGLESSSNISLLLFVLSAISPDKMSQAAKNVASTLKPGGILLLRDYGRYDEAQIKLGTSRNKLLGENFYVKHDGTRCYYFTIEDVKRLFGTDGDDGAGLEVLELKYVQRVYKNRSDGTARRRVWVQARFRKPLQ